MRRISAMPCKTVGIFTTFLVLFNTGCKTSPRIADKGSDFYFTLMQGNHTNIHFNNKLTESDSINFLTRPDLYMGSGVGVGDFNNDGLQDIFFAGEQVSCKLYLNKGNFQFEDITDKAGLNTEKWCTGVSVVDINNDGLLDIYVCASHSPDPKKRKNLLFINQGNLKFSEQAAEYGLDDPGFSTQAAFFDYDNDGYQDMYLMNHNGFRNERNNIITKDESDSSFSSDKLYRNEGIPPGKNHPVFKDVSLKAGIRNFGNGLGVAISDFNKDGWPDIYVTNDLLGKDLLWLNNKNGTFSNSISRSMHHQGYNSKGIDAADINNDQLCDIAVLDMQPETNYRRKTMYAYFNPKQYDMEQSIGSNELQYSRNMLQLHNGNRNFNNAEEPFFSEIGQLSGVSETDWSWSILIADFDNDGWKDIHITNGIAKDFYNNDFLDFRSKQNGLNIPIGMTGGINGSNRDNIGLLRKQLDSYGSIKMNNYFFHNNGNLTFSNRSEETGFALPSVSQGAVYVDLDNDGDLDLVINNMDQEASIWRNEIRKSSTDSTHNFLSIKLQGGNLNRSGIGVNATLYADGKVQFLEQYPAKGYLSSIDNRLHFGIGKATQIDSLKIAWPDGLQQVIRNIRCNQLIDIKHSNAREQGQADGIAAPSLFRDVAKELNIFFKHDETNYFDFGKQPGLPQKYSQLGPPLAIGDVNGDGLTDFFVGGGSYQSGRIFIQNANGGFSSRDLVGKEKPGEDAAAIFFDADGDNDLDLLIVEGSTEFGNSSSLNVPCLYKNDGRGNFTLDTGAIPASVSNISQVVTVGDYDGDGDLDIFIGGRIVANQYPVSPHSFILRNDKGIFTDVTKSVCAPLEKVGLITGALWTDFNNDRKLDLVICGEWMPVRFFKNTNGKLEEITATTGLANLSGLWRCLHAVDIDKDGDIDFIVGNMGLNNKYHVSAEKPLKLYADDIDGNGSLDLIPAFYIKNDKGSYELFPAIDRAQFAEEVPTIKNLYPLNEDFANVNMEQLLAGIHQKSMVVYKCETMASCWIENIGNGHFKVHELPQEAQFAPVNAIIANDFDKDGNIDLLLAGNEYQSEGRIGRYDASYGQLLIGDGKGRFAPIRPVRSGFIIDGDVRNMICITNKKKEKLVVAAVNNGWLRCFMVDK